MSWRVTLMTVVHPWQCDQMGHWNVRFYAGAFDDASFQFLGWLAGAEPPEGLGWADVGTAIDYRAEVRAGSLVTVETMLERLGRSSVRYRHRLTDSLTGKLQAEAVTTSVRFDLTARQAVPLEPALRARAGQPAPSGAPEAE